MVIFLYRGRLSFTTGFSPFAIAHTRLDCPVCLTAGEAVKAGTTGLQSRAALSLKKQLITPRRQKIYTLICKPLCVERKNRHCKSLGTVFRHCEPLGAVLRATATKQSSKYNKTLSLCIAENRLFPPITM